MSGQGSPRTLLTSWKAIAKFFDRDARTVQRWEKEEGLPVQRHPHRRQSSVYAYTDDLETWWQARGSRTGGDSGASTPRTPAAEQADPLPTANEHLADNPRATRRLRLAATLGLGVVALIVGAGLTFVVTVAVRTPADVTPPGTVLAEFEGAPPNGHFSEGPLADLNGDARTDVVLAAPRTREVYLLFGGSVPRRARFPGAATVTIRGSDNGAYIPVSARDLDGDGLRDLVISVQLYEPDAFTATGPTYVVRGRRAWPATLRLPAASDVTFRYGPPGDIRMGACTTDRPIDLNRDGIDDLVLGAADYSPERRASAGAVFVFFGRRAWPRVLDLDRDADITIRGSRPGEGLDAGCDAGDFNGDGRSDLAILATEGTLWHMLGGRGRHYVFFGRDGWPSVLEAERDANLRLDGRRPGGALMPPVLADINADGFDDLITTTSQAASSRADSVEFPVVFGRRTVSQRVLPVSAADLVIRARGDLRLPSLSRANLDDDGADDLLLADGGSGRVLAVLGRPEWPARALLDELNPLPVFQGEPGQGPLWLHLGDVDGDWFPEILIASRPPIHDGRPSRGKAWLIKPHRTIAVDLRPTSQPNILYLPGVLVARVPGTALTDADPIDPSTVRVAGMPPIRFDWRDFDTDGHQDLQLYFETKNMRVTETTRQVSLAARTRQGGLVVGVDTVLVMRGATHGPSLEGTAESRRPSQ